MLFRYDNVAGFVVRMFIVSQTAIGPHRPRYDQTITRWVLNITAYKSRSPLSLFKNST
jgi:hypothetical protein